MFRLTIRETAGARPTRWAASLVALALSGLTLVACTTTPRVELQAYLGAADELKAVTDDVLNIIAPYERLVIRNVATEDGAPSTGVTSGSGTNEFGLPSTADLQRAAESQTAQLPGSAQCKGRIGPDQFCYAYRDAHATIGDPMLVGTVRRMFDVLARYDAILAAYAGGVSGDILAADLRRVQNRLSGGLLLLGGATAALPSPVTAAFEGLRPIAEAAGQEYDRVALRQFLLQHVQKVDDAYKGVAASSTELYSNVREGTQIMVNQKGVSSAELASLERRRDHVRAIIANWTVMIDEARLLLADLKIAVDNSDALETRLREMGLTPARTIANADIIRSQINSLGLPPN